MTVGIHDCANKVGKKFMWN